MVSEKKELLEEKLAIETEDFYIKGRILMEDNSSVEALNNYKEACIKYFDTKEKLDEIKQEEEKENKAEEERIERIRARIKERPLYKFAEYWGNALDNLFDKCEETYKTYKKRK